MMEQYNKSFSETITMTPERRKKMRKESMDIDSEEADDDTVDMHKSPKLYDQSLSMKSI
jgi:hypothetical protein